MSVYAIKLPVAGWLLMCGMISASGNAAIRQPWETLPPTPVLPPPARSAVEPIAGAKIWYAEYGAGRPVVLLHGGFASSNYFGSLIPVLAHHYRVIVIDSRGHGRSANDGTQITYHRMALDVLAILDGLHLSSVALIGWSDGGIVGLDIAMNQPQRLSKLFVFGADSDFSQVLDVSKSPVFSEYLARTAREYKTLSPTPDKWDEFSANISKMWGSEPKFSDSVLSQITVPTWIVDADHEEAIARADTDRMARLIPRAREMILPGVSHFAFLQSPGFFNRAVLEFLR